MIAEGEVILAPLPQADGKTKTRPVLVLRRMPPFGDLLVCGVTTQLKHVVKGFDEIIEPVNEDFAASGLKAPSLVRLGFLAVLPPDNALARIGAVSKERHQRLLDNLCRHLKSQ